MEVTIVLEEQEAPQTYNKYLESMRKANKKYRENNKAKFNEYQKQYYQNHKNDESFVKMQREKALKSYYKRKAQKLGTEISIPQII
jgi:hypothetical protein